MSSAQKLIGIVGTVLSLPLTFVLFTIVMAHIPIFIPYFFYLWGSYVLLLFVFYIWVIILFANNRQLGLKWFMIYFIVISLFIFIDIIMILDGLIGL